MTRLDINPDAKLAWQGVGDHGTEVLVVDDFLMDPDSLSLLAHGLAYQPPSLPDFYPGLKALATLPGSPQTKSWVAERMLARLYPEGRPAELSIDDFDSGGAFSVFSIDRAAIPDTVQDQHTDSFAWLAMVLHLSTSSEGRGTAMWEHRPTGMQQWLATDPVRLQAIEATLGLRLTTQIAAATRRLPVQSNDELSRAMFARNPGRRPFTTDEDATWRLLAYVPARWNRLVVYPTWQIHSVVDMSDDSSLRLTYNQMVDYPYPRQRRRDRTPYPRGFYRDPAGLFKR